MQLRMQRSRRARFDVRPRFRRIHSVGPVAMLLLRLLRLLLRRPQQQRLEDEPPTLMLIPGGFAQREARAARSASALFPSVATILLSSGMSSEAELLSCCSGGSPAMVIIIDRQAVDTVSNFTSTAAAISSAGVSCVVVSTSDTHMLRTYLIAFIVLGGHGIRVVQHPVAPAHGEPSESILRCVRDVLRALLYVCSNGVFDGSSIATLVHPQRARDVQTWRAAQQISKQEEARTPLLQSRLRAVYGSSTT